MAHLPVGVLPSAGVLPTSIDITTRRDAGSQVEEGLEAIAISDLQVDASGLVPEDKVELTIPEDSTNPDAFDGNGTARRGARGAVPAPRASSPSCRTRPLPTSTSTSATGEVARPTWWRSSASAGSDERVQIADPEPGTYWVLVQNWEAIAPAAPTPPTW